MILRPSVHSLKGDNTGAPARGAKAAKLAEAGTQYNITVKQTNFIIYVTGSTWALEYPQKIIVAP